MGSIRYAVRSKSTSSNAIMTDNNARTSMNATASSAIEILSNSVSSRKRKGCSCGPSNSIIIGISISAFLFLIAVAILIWFFRDYNEYLEETEARLKLKEDEKEAERNKKDPEKRKRAINATIEKQKLHVKSKKDDIADTESSRSRSSSINTDASCSSVSVSIGENRCHACHDKECDKQHRHQTLGDHNTMSDARSNIDSKEDSKDNNHKISTGQNCDTGIIGTQKVDDNDHDEPESTTIVTTNIAKAVSDAEQVVAVDTGRDGIEDDYDNMCSICFEPFSDNEDLSWSKTNKCQHVFHSECLVTWLMKHEDCPICRTPLMTRQDFLDRTYADISSDNNEKKKGGKSKYEIVRSESNDGNPQTEPQNVTNQQVEEDESNLQITIESDIESGTHNIQL